MVKKKEEKELSCCEKIVGCIIITSAAAAVLILTVLIIMQAGQEEINIALTQDVANEICMQLTGEDYVVASDDYHRDGLGNGGNLICDVLNEGLVRGIIVNR